MRIDPSVRPLAPRRAVPGVRPVPAPRPADAVDPEARRTADVEVSVRLYADGTQISVVRRTVPEEGGGRRTVGIEAVIR